MQWQDWVFAAAGFILGASLIPTIRGDDKPALSTGLITTVVISIVSVTMATMGLWLSAATNLIIVAAWGTISWQKLQQIRRQHRPVIEEIEEEIIHGVHDGVPHSQQGLREDEDGLVGSRRS